MIKKALKAVFVGGGEEWKEGKTYIDGSLHNRRYFFAFFRRAKVSTPRSLGACLKKWRVT